MKIFILITACVLSLLSPLAVGAQFFQPDSGFGRYLEDTFRGTDIYRKNADVEQTLPVAIGRIIQSLLGFVGVILLVVVVYAGFLWITAGGNDEQVKKAKTWIKNAVIGMFLIFAAFIITSFIVTFFQSRLVPEATPTSGTSLLGP